MAHSILDDLISLSGQPLSVLPRLGLLEWVRVLRGKRTVVPTANDAFEVPASLQSAVQTLGLRATQQHCERLLAWLYDFGRRAEGLAMPTAARERTLRDPEGMKAFVGSNDALSALFVVDRDRLGFHPSVAERERSEITRYIQKYYRLPIRVCSA